MLAIIARLLHRFEGEMRQEKKNKKRTKQTKQNYIFEFVLIAVGRSKRQSLAAAGDLKFSLLLLSLPLLCSFSCKFVHCVK